MIHVFTKREEMIMKKRRILMYVLFIAANILIWLSLYLQRTVGSPGDRLSLLLVSHLQWDRLTIKSQGENEKKL